jgi:NADP-dependent aldehyde dehydrogenase
MYGVDFTIGKTLVQHPLIKAVGFTGSFSGGKALYDLAQQRAEPIPVFAEMGSVNPVFIMPEKLKDEIEDIALRYAISITQSAGQFCTNPGLLIAIDDPALQQFKQILAQKIIETKPVKMLHQGIASSYKQKREAILKVLGVGLIGETQFAYEEDESIPTLTEVPASLFKADTKLSEELFGPFSMIVRCKDIYEMIGVAEHMQGQLTCSLMATNSEIISNTQLVDILKERCGRLILNGVPTGVEVALAMHHGGPFPATTDNRFTAVGADGIKRFARPICFQNWDQHLLPEPLQDENPLQIWRVVNNELTKNSIINTSL